MSTTRETIATLLREALRPLHLDVRDESARHTGHPGAAGGGGHFRVTIVSPLFEGLGPLERHRAVYAALGDRLGREIHALGLEALAPSQWTPGPQGRPR